MVCFLAKRPSAPSSQRCSIVRFSDCFVSLSSSCNFFPPPDTLSFLFDDVVVPSPFSPYGLWKCMFRNPFAAHRPSFKEEGPTLLFLYLPATSNLSMKHYFTQSYPFLSLTFFGFVCQPLAFLVGFSRGGFGRCTNTIDHLGVALVLTFLALDVEDPPFLLARRNFALPPWKGLSPSVIVSGDVAL